MTITIDVSGLTGALADVERITNKRAINAGLTDVADHVRRVVSKYPPETSANRPPAPFYIRGRGTKYKSGRLRLTSEDLLHRWEIRTLSWDEVLLRNDASYAIYVHGDRQPLFHKRRGWRRAEHVVRAEQDKIGRIFVKAWESYR